MLFANVVNVLSSAKLLAFIVSITYKISLKKELNRADPTIDLYRTPEITFRKPLFV